MVRSVCEALLARLLVDALLLGALDLGGRGLAPLLGLPGLLLGLLGLAAQAQGLGALTGGDAAALGLVAQLVVEQQPARGVADLGVDLVERDLGALPRQLREAVGQDTGGLEGDVDGPSLQLADHQAFSSGSILSARASARAAACSSSRASASFLKRSRSARSSRVGGGHLGLQAPALLLDLGLLLLDAGLVALDARLGLGAARLDLGLRAGLLEAALAGEVVVAQQRARGGLGLAGELAESAAGGVLGRFVVGHAPGVTRTTPARTVTTVTEPRASLVVYPSSPGGSPTRPGPSAPTAPRAVRKGGGQSGGRECRRHPGSFSTQVLGRM